jgi:hypothetical protein
VGALECFSARNNWENGQSAATGGKSSCFHGTLREHTRIERRLQAQHRQVCIHTRRCLSAEQCLAQGESCTRAIADTKKHRFLSGKHCSKISCGYSECYVDSVVCQLQQKSSPAWDAYLSDSAVVIPLQNADTLGATSERVLATEDMEMRCTRMMVAVVVEESLHWLV